MVFMRIENNEDWNVPSLEEVLVYFGENGPFIWPDEEDKFMYRNIILPEKGYYLCG